MPPETSAMPPITTAGTPPLGPPDFLLGPEAFVARCAAIATASPDGTAAPPDAGDQARLVAALRAGRSRLEVAQAVLGAGMPPPHTPEAALSRDWDRFVVTDLLERFAPDDDARFVDQVYDQILARKPAPMEALEARFDLRRGAVDRLALIARIAATSPDCRLSDPPAGSAAAGAPDGAPGAAQTLLGTDGSRRQLIAEHRPGLGTLIGAGIACPGLGDDGTVAPGWVLTGPKRSLAPGPWHLIVDLLQPEGAAITLDIVANSGLDTLLRIELSGPALLTTRFEVAPFHHFVEIRLNKPEQAEALHRLRLRSLSLEKTS